MIERLGESISSRPTIRAFASRFQSTARNDLVQRANKQDMVVLLSNEWDLY